MVPTAHRKWKSLVWLSKDPNSLTQQVGEVSYAYPVSGVDSIWTSFPRMTSPCLQTPIKAWDLRPFWAVTHSQVCLLSHPRKCAFTSVSLCFTWINLILLKSSPYPSLNSFSVKTKKLLGLTWWPRTSDTLKDRYPEQATSGGGAIWQKELCRCD